MYTGDKKESILLLSADARLTQLLTAEAQELCLPLRVEATLAALSPTRLSALRLVLWDMDSTVLPTNAALPPECLLYGISTAEPPIVPDIPLTRRLTRPFSVDELRGEMLRIAYTGQATATAEPSASLPLQLQEDGLTLQAGELTVTLTEHEAAILSLLLQHRGLAVSKEALLRAISPDETAPTASNKLEVHLCHLRRKLEQPLGLRLISTVRGQGYRLLP